ncbi:MAG: hypothetical protein II399_04860, partial [Lachnospiraceae bacterium]|nr:hypothetical protein [Lachnospiraceae bacterium]
MLSLFNIFNIVHVVGTLLTAVLCIIIIREKSSRMEKLLGLVGISILIDMIAYYLEMNAVDLHAAIVCTKFQLIAILLMNTFWLVLIFRLSDVPVKTPFLIVLMAIDIVLGFYYVGFGFDKVYNSIQFVNTGVFPHLEIKEGIVFMISCGFYIFISILMIVLIIRRAFKDGSKVAKEYIFLILSFIFPVLALIYRFTPFYSRYTYIPIHFAYVLSFAMVTLIIFRFRMFDTVQAAKEDIVNSIEDAVIVIDVRKNLLYANEVAYNILPELKFANRSDNMINRVYRNNKKVLSIGAREFQVSVKPFYDKKMLKGYHLWLYDKTEENKY